MAITASVFNTTIEDLLARSREPKFAHPRQLAMAICTDVLGINHAETGRHFGGRDHITLRIALLKYGALVRHIEKQRNSRGATGQ
jgi:chromosomal replication initiator protein